RAMAPAGATEADARGCPPGRPVAPSAGERRCPTPDSRAGCRKSSLRESRALQVLYGRRVGVARRAGILFSTLLTRGRLDRGVGRGHLLAIAGGAVLAVDEGPPAVGAGSRLRRLLERLANAVGQALRGGLDEEGQGVVEELRVGRDAGG